VPSANSHFAEEVGFALLPFSLPAVDPYDASEVGDGRVKIRPRPTTFVISLVRGGVSERQSETDEEA
jgi:hypothetical protein